MPLDPAMRPVSYAESLYGIKSAYENIIRFNEPQADLLSDQLFEAYRNACEQIKRKEHVAVGGLIGRDR